MAVLAVFVLGALWAPVIGRFESLWIYLQMVTAYLVMPFVGIFFLGVLWKRITTRGVMASVLTGFVAGPLLMFDSRHPFIPFLQTPVLRPWLHGGNYRVPAVRLRAGRREPPGQSAVPRAIWS